MVRYNITEKEKVEVRSGYDKESVKEKEDKSIKSNIKNKENENEADIINLDPYQEIPSVKSENKQQNIEYLF